jgi:prophage DNA circulation protein
MALFNKKSEPRIEVVQIPARAPIMAAPPPTPAAPPRKAYGIADAILLMRSLPVDQNVDLVVQVIRATLASMNVKVQDIIEDAVRKEKATEAGISALHGKVAELERELEARRQDILGLEADLKETTAVKERLELSEEPTALPADAVAETTPPVVNGQFGSYQHQP